MKQPKKETWSSKWVLILAMAGNAIGLGNFWRFPYMAANYGGAAFILPYFVSILILGVPILICEWYIGRAGGSRGFSTAAPMIYLQAERGMKKKHAMVVASVIGALAFSVTLLVNSYYNHIIGWTLNYSFKAIFGTLTHHAQNTTQVFTETVSTPWQIFVFWLISVAIIGFAVSRGIKNGIEKWTKYMIPLLYIFAIVLAVKALTLGSPVNPEWSALKGLNFVWQPDFSKLNWKSAMAAAGQVFFTLSVGMGIIMHYASFLKKDDDIVVSTTATVALNEFAEVILAASIVIPITYAYMGEEGLSAQTIGLTFVTMPNVFRDMPLGSIMAFLWFVLLFFAGITSAIAMYSYLTSLIMECTHFSRKQSALIIFGMYVVFGLPVALEPIFTKTTDFIYFTEMDNWVGNYLLLIVGLIEILVVGWAVKWPALEEINRGGLAKIPRWFFGVFMRYVAPAFLIVVLLFSTRTYIMEGYFNLIPDYVRNTANATVSAVFANLARVVVLLSLVGGYLLSYWNLKREGEKL